MALFPSKGSRLIQVKITKKDKHRTVTGWPRPLNRGGRLIQVTNTAFVRANNRDFGNWPLNRGWPLNTGPLYTGSTVFSMTRRMKIGSLDYALPRKVLSLIVNSFYLLRDVFSIECIHSI